MNRVAPVSLTIFTLVAMALAAPSTPGCLQIGPDAGADDAACGNDAGQTFGEQCATVYTEECKQAARCSISISSITDCASNYAAQYCCTGSACTTESCQAPAQVSACQADIDVEDCNAVVNVSMPASCSAFVTSQ